MSFVKYNNFWWEYDGKTPKNDATLNSIISFGISSHCDITNCKIDNKTKNYLDLDWKNTSIWNDNSRYGFVDRNGVFYGCDFRHHELQAKIVHKSSRKELEKLGWIVIVENSWQEKSTGKLMALYYTGNDYILPTTAQLEYLTTRNDLELDWIEHAIEHGNVEKARIYEQNLLKEKNNKKIDKNNEKTL